MRGRRWSRAGVFGAVLAALVALTCGLATELKTSWGQAELLSRMVRGLTFRVEPGPSDAIRFPSAGPYDERLGYVGLPDFIDRLGARGFTIERQARLSPRLQGAIDRGVFPIYREKTAAGITVLDRAGATVFEARFPERTYADFEVIPRPIREKPVDDARSIWLKPTLLCEVQFASLTRDGALREPVFLRLRPDRSSSRS